MILTDEAPIAEQASPAGTGTPTDAAAERFRVVLDGIGDRTGAVASGPIDDRDEALAAADRAAAALAGDVAAGRLRVSVLTETVWTQRGARHG